MKTSARSQCHREVVQEITQLNKDQDVKTNDHVSRFQGVLHSLAVRVRDDAGFVTEARSDPQPHDSDHGKSRFEAARRDEDDQMFSRCASGASWEDGNRARLRVGTHCSKDHRMTLADQRIQVEAWRSPFTTPVFRIASATNKRADREPTSRISWCVLTARIIALTHRLLTAMIREMDEESLSAKRVQTRSWVP